MNTKKARFCTLMLLVGVNISGWGCSGQGNGLEIADLDANELQLVTRFLTIERAKAVELVDPEVGLALLDSLSAAWGDSALVDAYHLLPKNPERAVQLDKLLARILAADQDSLLESPRPDRLAAPLPVPAPSGR